MIKPRGSLPLNEIGHPGNSSPSLGTSVSTKGMLLQALAGDGLATSSGCRLLGVAGVAAGDWGATAGGSAGQAGDGLAASSVPSVGVGDAGDWVTGDWVAFVGDAGDWEDWEATETPNGSVVNSCC